MITYACNHTEPNVAHRVYSALKCPMCERQHTMITILDRGDIETTKANLQAFAKKHDLRPDWHEPDEAGVTAKVTGRSFDNAGFQDYEYNVTLKVNGKPAAIINLATLFAVACQ